MATTDACHPLETTHNTLEPRLASPPGPQAGTGPGAAHAVHSNSNSNSITFSGSARDFIRFTLANDAFSFAQGSARGARKMPFPADSAPSSNAARALLPSAARAGAPTNG